MRIGYLVRGGVISMVLFRVLVAYIGCWISWNITYMTAIPWKQAGMAY